jgi:hypothetical protein
LQEFCRVNRPVILLWQMGSELARPDHHSEMWCKHHTPPRAYWRARGTHNTCHRRLSFLCKRFKISLEIAALDVAAPFTVELGGDATILSPVTVDDLITEVSCHDAWQHARLMRHAHRWRCVHSRGGARMCYRQLLPPSLMV